MYIPEERIARMETNAALNRKSTAGTIAHLGLVSLLLAFGAARANAQTFAYVANFAGNNVSVIATATNTVVATVPVGNGPAGVAITPNGTRAYVTNQAS